MKTETPCPRDVTTSLAASRGDSLRASLVCRTVRAYWFARPAMASADFRRASAVFLPDRPPPSLCSGFILTRYESPSEFRDPDPPVVCLRSPPAHLSELHSPSRYQSTASTPMVHLRSPPATGFPSLLGSVRDVSHVLDGLLRHVPCEFVSPRNHVRDSPFRVFPPRSAVRARRPPFFPRDVHAHSLPLLFKHRLQK